MGNTGSAEEITDNEPCLGRSHHETTGDTLEKRNQGNVNGAEGKVSTSEIETEASDDDTPLCSRSRRNEEISINKEVDAKYEGIESTPAQEFEENPPTKSKTKHHERSEIEEEQSVLCEDNTTMKSSAERPGEESKEGQISDSEGQTHKTDDPSAASTSDNARMDEEIVTQKEGLSAKEVAHAGDEDGQKNELEEKKEYRTNGILSRVITRVKNATLRRKQESYVITEQESELPFNTDDVIAVSESHEEENPEGITEDVTEAATENENSEIPLEKKGRWKNFITQLRKKKLFLKRQDREVKKNVRNRKRKLKFLTFMTRIKELECSNEGKDECSSSSSGSVICRDISIEGGDKEKEESKSNVFKEKSKEEYEREPLEEKEQWRWDAEECLGGMVIKKRR